MHNDVTEPVAQHESGSAQKDAAQHQAESVAEKKDVVSYETYRKTVGEVKALKAKLAELQSQREAEEQQRLAEQGKWREKAELLEKTLKEKEQKFNEAVRSFAQKIFTESARQVALQVGVRKEAIDDVLKVTDFSDVEIGEDFSINTDQLKTKLEELSKHKPWFFEQAKKEMKTVMPSGKGLVTNKKLEELSWDELRELARLVKD